jgi:hypothetical protein
MQRIAPLNVCGAVAKCVLNTLIIGANLVALGMLVVRESINETLS